MSLSSHASSSQTLSLCPSTQLIPKQSGCGFRLYAGDRLKVIDLEGAQVSDLYCMRMSDIDDPLSSGRSIDYGDKILFSTGDILYSQDGHRLLEIVADTCGRHDFLVTPCTAQMFKLYRGSSDFHPSCKKNLFDAFRELGVKPSNIGTTFNIFMNVTFDPQGRIQVETPLSRAGSFIEFEALDNIFVGLTACADEGSNGGCCKPIAFEITRQ